MRCSLSKANGPVCRHKLVLLYLCSILLTQSYAPEPNPGPRPVKFPCAVCHKAVKWTTPGVCCDSCEVWYHQECMGMPDGVYNGLKYVSWECFQCGIPNISTSIFDTTIFEVSNSFSQLSSNEHLSPDSEISFSFPNATSSPSRPGAQQDTAKRKDLPLRVVTLNCQSIKTGGKPAQLQNMISSLQGEIVIGSESWLNSSIKSQEVFQEGFNSYRRDRPAGSGGGVFILVSKQFHSSQPEELIVEENTDCELLWVKVRVKGSSDLYIGSFYRPPDKTDPEYLQCLQTTINRIPRDKGAHLWLGGDFNLPDINWEVETVAHYGSYSTLSNQLLTVMRDSFLDQVVMEPTRITETTSNTLDLFFTSNKTLINKVEILPGISDHEAVYVIDSSLRPMKVNIPARKVYQYREADYKSMKEELKSFQKEFEEKAPTADVNELWTIFKYKIHSLMDQYVPSKLLRGNKLQKPWISREVKALMRKRDKLFKRQRKTGRTQDIRHYRETKARLQKADCQSYWNFVDHIIDKGDPEQEHKPKQKRFWSFIKSLRKDSSGIAPLKENGRLHAEPKDKANILNRQYESTWTKEDKSSIPSPEGTPFPSMPEIEVTNEGVVKLLLKLNPNKASGPDLLPARVLKEMATEIGPFLTIIFQKSFDTGIVPKDWRTANVTAIFKKRGEIQSIKLQTSLPYQSLLQDSGTYCYQQRPQTPG